MGRSFDLKFIGSDITTEVCPHCGEEIEILCDGTTTCPECGHEEVLPCTEFNYELCDWYVKTRCTPFPIRETI